MGFENRTITYKNKMGNVVHAFMLVSIHKRHDIMYEYFMCVN